ncbi:MAG: HNH endonuclease [Puniceicoccaceae bacterium]|nr:MAG: HNH endonuclease [Puniceicoccaceae bacterium]
MADEPARLSKRKYIRHKQFRKTTYPKAKKYLIEDIGARCAYSMLHENQMGGETCLEVEHFDPRRKKDKIQRYSNLLLSCRHCNLKKSTKWPTEEQYRKGIYFIDPTIELDYGKHIFEDPETHEVFGVTPAGKWQILQMDLNAGFLVRKRKERAEWNKIKSGQAGVMFECKLGQENEARNSLSRYEDFRQYDIPEIPLKKNPKRNGIIKA